MDNTAFMDKTLFQNTWEIYTDSSLKWAPLAYACRKPGWIWGFLFPFFLEGVGKSMNLVKFEAQEIVVHYILIAQK